MCISGVVGGQGHGVDLRRCGSEHFPKTDWFPMLCVVSEFNALLGQYYDVRPKLSNLGLLKTVLTEIQSTRLYSYRCEYRYLCFVMFFVFVFQMKNVCAFSGFHAPTLPTSEKSPSIRQDLYDKLDNLLCNIQYRAVLYLTGDFNAKTGSGYIIHPTIIGKCGKGQANSNGEHLLDSANV